MMDQNLNNPDLNRTGINRYKPSILENNWNEDRFDKNYVKQHKPLTNVVLDNFYLLKWKNIFLNIKIQSFSHQYETTYTNLTNNVEPPTLLQEKANLIKGNFDI